MHERSSAGSGHGYSSSDQSIPPRDPPFGKGNVSNDTMHEPTPPAVGMATAHRVKASRRGILHSEKECEQRLHP